MRDAPVGDVGLNKTEHLLGRLRDLNKHAVVDLEEAEELEDFAGLGSDLVDTSNTDNEVHLWLGGNVEVTSGTCSPLEANLLLLLRKVLLRVGFGALEDDLALGLSVLQSRLVSTRFESEREKEKESVPKDG